MRVRAVRWTLLAVIAVALAATFAAVQFRAATRSMVRVEAPTDLGAAPGFDLVDRHGRRVTGEDLAGRPWVADFIFTRCALACPRLTSIMRRLAADAPDLARVSFSVDPAHDRPEVLDDYADALGVDDPDWLFLTGEPERVRSLVVDGFKLPVVETAGESVAPGEAILHSNRFVLVDAEGRIRGYYEVTRSEEYEKLLDDLAGLERRAPHPGTKESDGMVSEGAIEREIEELHAFFEDWFLGRVDDDEATFERFAGVLGADFAIVGPSGRELGREAILTGVRDSHASRAGEEFSIWVEAVQVRDCHGERCLATYQEWQRQDGAARGRLSTVLFALRPEAPNGVEWLHVQETWLPGGESGAD